MSPPILGWGTQLQLGDSATPTEHFSTIEGVKDFDLPSGKTDQVDVTSHSSLLRTKEYIAGIIETGELKFEIFFDPSEATHQDLWGLKASGETCNWKVISTDEEGTEFTFAANVQDMEIGFPVEDAITAKVEIKLTGPVTMAGYDS